MEPNTNNNKNAFVRLFTDRKLLFSLLAIAVFALISWAYFYPDDVQNNVLHAQDIQAGLANGQEVASFHMKTGKTYWWNNSLFCGMPSFQMSPSYSSNESLNTVGKVLGLGFTSPVNLLFIMMLGFYILMLACNVKWYVAIPGAIAYGFSSYFIILIGAGHIWKYLTLAYIPPTIAGVIWCYRGKYLLGGAVAALFAALQIVSNHIQMSYYFLFVILALVIAYLVKAIKDKEMKKWGIATGTLLVAAILAVGANMSNLYNTYEFSKETMRGGRSELPAVATSQNAKANDKANLTKNGLNRDYITQWSYGIGETNSLMIPNVCGGSSVRLTNGETSMLSLAETDKAKEMLDKNEISQQDYQYLQQFPQYFGDQPMTNGPVYVGALICALFLLGCCVVKGPVKWALLIVTILSVLLSWGHNFMGLTNVFIDYLPFYNKFRTVSSILVIAEFTMPMLAMLALQKIFTEKDFFQNHSRALYASFGITAVICLFIWMFPGVFSLYSQSENEQFIQSGVAQQVPTLTTAIEAIRRSMIASDAIRSFVIIAIGFGILLVYFTKKINAVLTGSLVTVLVLIDLYTINKRYLSSSSFTSDSGIATQPFQPRTVDQQIKRDTTMNYRVFDVQHFSDALPSTFHKAVGGYSPAKLNRFQDLIDYQIAKNNMQVINMLNAKYIITSDSTVMQNPGALGNAWFVDSLTFVNTPVEEMHFLDKFNPKTQAVADAKFKSAIGGAIPAKASGDTIYEVTYAPDELNYHAVSKNGGLAVFSEIYFPWGWQVSIDGKPVEMGRVNYVLRALRIPAGSHNIHFLYDPQSVHTTETIGYCSNILIAIAVIAAIAGGILQAVRRKPEDEAPAEVPAEKEPAAPAKPKAKKK
ncbi:MAG: YfhO family protein [Muribaculaceae bacterium]|jgi:hypothetical protein|nr:YfhO family protein [Muribaculaceae bacterium]